MKPELFNYIEYQKYLNDFYTWSKSKRPFFSYQYMAMKAGMDTSNLAKVIVGKRHLPNTAIPRFKTLCGFTDREYEYFETMIRWGKARVDKKAQQLFNKLIDLQGSHPRLMEVKEYKFYSQWYYTAIYALLECIEFRGNFRNLAARLTPSVSVNDVKEALTLLMQLGLVKIDTNGKYVPCEKVLTTGENWKSYAIKEFQRETLKIAIHSLEKHKKDERDISTLTLTASKADIVAIKKLTKEYRRAIMDLISKSNDAERVYQLNIQLFPMSM